MQFLQNVCFFFVFLYVRAVAPKLAVSISLLASQNSQHSYGQIQPQKTETGTIVWVCWVFWTENNHRSL